MLEREGRQLTETDLFAYKATVDWVELEITTTKPTTFLVIGFLAHVRYVKRINPGSGGSANTFRFRVHDVASWAQLEEIIAGINQYKPLHSTPLITAVEVSFDAFSKRQDADDLMEKTAEFYWLLQKPSSSNQRAASDYVGSAEALRNHKANLRLIRNRHSIYISNKDDPISQRIYYKTTDNRRSLPVEQHRARYEVTLQHGACPFHTIEEAKTFKFTELAEWFKFRKPRPDLNEFNKIILNAQQQLSVHGQRRKSGGGIRVHNPKTLADTVLNRICYDKLRELTKRMNRKRLPRKLRVIRS